MVAALQAGGTYTEAQAKAIAKEYFKNLDTEQTKKRENLVVKQPTTPLTGTDINGNQITIQHPIPGPSTTKPFFQEGTYNRYIYPTDAATRLNQLGIKIPTVK
jgi:hypothetical protein